MRRPDRIDSPSKLRRFSDRGELISLLVEALSEAGLVLTLAFLVVLLLVYGFKAVCRRFGWFASARSGIAYRSRNTRRRYKTTAAG
jgi:hypothetical protein